jgi:hypothetical protein
MNTWKYELKPSTIVSFKYNTKPYIVVGYNADRSKILCTSSDSQIIQDNLECFNTESIVCILNNDNKIPQTESYFANLIARFKSLFF